MKTTIVTTTINVPTLLLKYALNAKSYGHKDLDFIVVGDRKTPPETADFCKSVPHYRCAYLDIPAQREYLNRFPELWSYLRFDSVGRRSIGILLAYENGADVVVTLDDDNFVMDQDFAGLHAVAGSVRELPTYRSTSGWFNVCSFLQAGDEGEFYHRGYPQKMRGVENGHSVTCSLVARRVAVNAGLWVGDPDIDAVTRMERQLVVCGFSRNWPGSNIALHPGTWSPFGSQNTALMRDAVPAYFLNPYTIRYEDIWGSYILTRIAEHFGDVVSYGEPLVRQDRNPHDPWQDLEMERNGMILTDDFCAALRSIPLTGATYHDCFGEIVAALPRAWTEGATWTGSQKEWRSKLIEGMAVWHSAFEKLGAGSVNLSI